MKIEGLELKIKTLQRKIMDLDTKKVNKFSQTGSEYFKDLNKKNHDQTEALKNMEIEEKMVSAGILSSGTDAQIKTGKEESHESDGDLDSGIELEIWPRVLLNEFSNLLR